MWSAIYDAMDFLWGIPLMILVIGTGIYMSIKFGFFQLAHIKTWWKLSAGELFSKKDDDDHEGQLSPIQALSAVLAGTVGSGNIAGVAAAIAIGGPGSVFWMWLIAIFGMATKMAEVALSVQYRVKGENGEYYGGPMYYMKKGLGEKGKTLAGIYAFAMLILVLTDACFVQPNTLATTAQDVFNVPLLVSGLVLVGLSLAVVLSGGVNKIGAFCEKLVPPMIILYIVGTLLVIIKNAGNIPSAFGMIFEYAFKPAPAIGGFAGSTITLAMARGASRGIFSNEAGEGTAAAVHATAKTDHPVHQSMYGIFEVFLDTLVICTLTSLAILTSGVWSNGNTGAILTFDAFRSSWGELGIIVLGIAVILFTYSSYLGFYVEFRTSIAYLFGEKAEKYLKWIFFIMPILAVTMEIEKIWDMADMAVGFIVIPNLIALFMLAPKFGELVKDYRKKINM